MPIGANAESRGGTLHLEAVVASPDGSLVLRESVSGSDPVKLGQLVAEKLLRRRGAEILAEVYGRSVAVPQQP